jgi:thiosulfate dehydrogenase
MENQQDKYVQVLLATIQRLTNLIWLLLAVIIVLPIIMLNIDEIELMFRQFTKKGEIKAIENPKNADKQSSSLYWQAPEMEKIKDQKKLDQILYGQDLIAYTSRYLGPNGSVQSLSNGMNCQNCHLQGGTKVFGNNYGSVASTYPKVRARSGKMESIEKRINDCFERSLNGKPLPENSKEMKAMVAYMKFLGSNVIKGVKAEGSGLKDLAFLDRPANPIQGKLVYDAKCASCHQPNGEGTIHPNGKEYVYPPLWGEHSYNDAAGLFRVSNMAKYVKYNMPFGVNHDNPQLSDEESWDVAAYINSMPRPHKNVPQDWPDIAKKPIDHPFGPYSDKYSEQQHKYGPFNEIKAAHK